MMARFITRERECLVFGKTIDKFNMDLMFVFVFKIYMCSIIKNLKLY